MADYDEFTVESVPLSSADPNEFVVDEEETEKRRRKVLSLGITEPVKAVDQMIGTMRTGAVASEAGRAEAERQRLIESTRYAASPIAGIVPPTPEQLTAGLKGTSMMLDTAGRGLEQIRRAQTFAVTLQPEAALQELGALPTEGGVSPYEEGMAKLPYALRLPSKAVGGLTEASPRFGLMAALTPAMGPGLAGAAAFGLSSETGFDPKAAVIAGVVPYLGRVSGAVAGKLATRLKITNEAAQNLMRSAGHVAGPTALISADQYHEIMKLPEADRPAAIEEALAANIGFIALSFPGGIKELTRRTPQWQGPLATGRQLPIPPAIPQLGPPRPTPREMQTLVSTRPQPPAPAVPGTMAEAERGMSVIEEIRTKNARTKAEIQKLFPQLSREEAGKLRIQAWGTAGDFGVTVSPTIPIPEPMGPPKPAAPKAPGAPERRPVVSGALDMMWEAGAENQPMPDRSVVERQFGALSDREWQVVRDNWNNGQKWAQEQKPQGLTRQQLQQQIITWQRELDKALANKDGNLQREAIRKLMELRRQLEGPETITPGKPPITPKPPLPGIPRNALGPEVPVTAPEPERNVPVLAEIRAKNARTKEQIRALFPQLTREQAAKLRDQAWGAQPAGGPSASGVTETAEVYGNVQPQEAQTGGVPVGQGSAGVRPQAQGGLPEGAQGEVLLTEVKFPLKPGPGGKGNVDQLDRPVEVVDGKWTLKGQPPPQEPPAAGAAGVPVPKPTPPSPAAPELGAKPPAPTEGPRPTDYDEYRALDAEWTRKLREGGEAWYNSTEQIVMRQQMEAIKNRNNGEVPPRPGTPEYDQIKKIMEEKLGKKAAPEAEPTPPAVTGTFLGVDAPMWTAKYIDSLDEANRASLIRQVKAALIEAGLKTRLVGEPNGTMIANAIAKIIEARKGKSVPGPAAVTGDPESIATALGIHFDHQFNGAKGQKYWSFTLYDKQGKLGTSISVPVGSTVDQVRALYEQKIIDYGDDPAAPRPPKSTTQPPPPPEAGAAPTPAPPPTPPAPVAPAAKAQTPPPPTPESLAAAPSAPPVPEKQGGKVPEDGETFTWRGATLRLSKGRFGWSVTQESPGPTEFSNTGYRSLTEFGRMGEEGQEPTMADLVAALDKAAAENKAESDKALRNAKRELKKAAKEGPGKDSASVIIHFSMTGDGLLNKLRSQTDVKTQIEMANLAAQAYQIAADVPPAKETSGAWTPQIVAESKAQNAKQAEVARRFAADLEARSKAAPGTEWKAWDIIDKAKRESTPAEPDELGLQRPEVFPQISTGWYEEATRPAEVVEDRWQSQFARNTEDMYRDPVEGQTTPYLIQAKLADLAEWERWAQRKAPEVLAKHKAENDEIRRLLLEKQPAVAAEWAERDRQAEEAAAKAAAEKKKGKRKKAAPPVPIPGETVTAPPVPEAPAAAPEEPPAHPIDALLAKVGVEGTGKVGEVMDSNGRKRPGGYTSPAMTEAQLTELSGLADKAGWDIQGYEPAKRKLRRGVFTPKPTAREKRIAELEKNISLYEQSLEPDSFVKVNLPEAQVRSRIAEYKAELERLKRGEEPPPEEPPPGAPVPIPPGPKPTAPAAPPVPPIATAMREGDREPTLNRFLLQSGGRGIGFARLAGEGEAYRSGRTTRAIFNKFQRKAADAGWESSFLPAPEGKGGTIMVRRKAAPAPEPSFEDETRRMRTDPQPGDVVEHPDFGRVEILPESTEETVRFEVLSSRKRASLPRTEWVQDMTLLDKTIEAPKTEGEMTPDKRAQIRTELGLDAFDVDRLSRAMGISQEEFYEMRPAYHRNAPAAMYAATKKEFLEFETAIDERNFKKVQRMYQYDPSLDQKLFQGFFRNVTKAKDPWVWEKESKAAEAEPNIEAMAEAEMEREPGAEPSRPPETTEDVTLKDAVDLLDDFQMTGEIETVRDLADAAEKIASERTGPMAQRLEEAVREYRNEAKQGLDADEYEERFILRISDVANELQEAESSVAYKTDPESGRPEPVKGTPVPITAESIAKTFNVPKEVGEATMQLANAMGLPMDKIVVVEGGRPSPDALLQLRPRYARALQKAIKEGAPQAKLYKLALKMQKRIDRETLFFDYNPKKPWLEGNTDPNYWKSVDPDLLCQKSAGTDAAVNWLKRELGPKYDNMMAWDILGRSKAAGLKVPCPQCYVFSARAGAGKAHQKLYIVGIGGYDGQLLRTKQGILDRIGSIRHYSSTDFKAEHIPGLLAEFADAAERKIPLAGYSKEVNLAHIFGPAKMYINLSTGRNRDVGLAVDQAAKVAQQYPNVSVVYTAFTDRENIAAARTKEIDHILPWHYSGQSTALIRQAVKDPFARDYTLEQSEKVRIDGKTGWDDFWAMSTAEKRKFIQTSSKNVRNAKPSERITDKMHGGDPEKYLALCKERGLLPKFPIFLEELQKTGELDAYMKFVGPEYGKHGVSKYPYEPVTTDVNTEAIEPAIRDRRQQIKDNEAAAKDYIDIARAIRDEVKEGTWDEGKVVVRQGPFQQKGRGAVEFLEDGTALIRALENPDASTGAHELAHIARRWILDPTVPAENRYGITDEHILAAEEWAGAKDGNWTVEAEEKFARGFERYLRDGKAPTSFLADLFDKFRTWLMEIYQRLKGSEIDLKISPEMRKVYDAIVSRGAEPVVPEGVRPEMMDLAEFTKSKPEGVMPTEWFSKHRDATINAYVTGAELSNAAAESQGLTPKKLKQAGYTLGEDDVWRKAAPEEGGESGQLFVGLPFPALKPIVRPLQQIRGVMGQRFKNIGGRHTLDQLADAADNKANVMGQQMGNKIRLGKTPVQQVAASAVIAADYDAANLPGLLAMVQGKGGEAEAGVRYAMANYAESEQLAKLGQRVFDMQIRMEHAAGINTEYAENYLPGIYDRDVWMGRRAPFTLGGGRGLTTAFKKGKTFESPFHAMGDPSGMYRPQTLRLGDLAEHRVRSGQRLINRKVMADSLKTVMAMSDGKPIAADLQRRTRGPGQPSYEVAPVGYQPREIIPGTRVAIHDDFVDLFDAVTGRKSAVAEWEPGGVPLGKIALELEGFVKHGLLLVDTFHASRMMQKEAFFNRRLPSWTKGRTLLEYSNTDLTRAVAEGEITQKMADWIRAKRPTAKLLLDAGLNVGRIQEAMYSGAVRAVQGKLADALAKLGIPKSMLSGVEFNKWVFEKLTRGAMMESSLIAFDRVQRANPTWSSTKVAQNVARDMNVYFGNLGRQGIFKSATALDASRLAFLAPQWVEGLARSEILGTYQLGKGAVQSGLSGSVKVGSLGTALGQGVFAYVLATQLLNLFTRGHFTWDNPEKGHKLDAWIPDATGKGPGFFISPLSVVAELTHDMIRYVPEEREGDVPSRVMAAAAHIARNRAAPLWRSAKILFTGRDWDQQKITGWDERLLKAGLALAPVPIGVSPSLRGDAPQGQVQRQLTASLGFKTEPVKTKGSQLYSLAREWLSKQEDPRAVHKFEASLKQEFGQSDYLPLRRSLEKGDIATAREEYDKLLEVKSPKAIMDAFRPYSMTQDGTLMPKPVAGLSRAETGRFLRSLTPEEVKLYKAATEEDRLQYRRLLEMLRQTQKPPAQRIRTTA